MPATAMAAAEIMPEEEPGLLMIVDASARLIGGTGQTSTVDHEQRLATSTSGEPAQHVGSICDGCSSDGEHEEEEVEEQWGRTCAATTAVCADVELDAGPGALSGEGCSSGDGTVAHGNHLGSPTPKLPIKQRKKHRKRRKGKK